MELQVFNNAEFGSVRTVTIDGEPMFVGKDVADILGYKNTRDALMTHVDEDDKNTVVISDGNRGNPNQTVINESGLYSLIFSSKLPNAKKFKHWVTSEVLPAIRKHGVYVVDKMLNNPYMLISALQELKAEREKRKILEETAAVQRQQITEMQPKASYYDVVLNCKDLVAISTISKDYGWSATTQIMSNQNSNAKSTVNNYVTVTVNADNANADEIADTVAKRIVESIENM